MELLKEKKVVNHDNPLQWHKYVVVYSSKHGDGIRHNMHEEVTPLTKEKYIKEHDYWNIISFVEIEGQPNKQDIKCAECHKPFKVGDKIINFDFTERTIVFLDKHLAYFAEVYEGDDILDTHEQCRYITHASHVKPETLAEYKRGQQLWDDGMKICNEIKKTTFKGWK